jgi:uncharacterized membrane protein
MSKRLSPSDSPRPSRLLGTLKALVRTRITAGLLTSLPIIITIWLVWVVFCWLRDASLWMVNVLLLSPWGRGALEYWGITHEQLTAEGLKALPPMLQWGISLFCVVCTFALLYLIGLFAANVIGRRMLELVDQIAARMPFVKTIYGALRQIFGLFASDHPQAFQRVALVPFPNELTRSVAFITNTFRDAETGEELCAAFIATTPNPTTGFVFILRRSDIVEVNWSVEEAVKVVMSGGILSPSYVTMLTGGRALMPTPPVASGVHPTGPSSSEPRP